MPQVALGHVGTGPRPTTRVDMLLANEDAAREYLLSFCWPEGEPYCPRCGHPKVYNLSNGQRMRCAACKYTFQPFSGRWINNGGLSCSDWIALTRMFEREASVHEITEALGLSYNTVYKALTAVRFAILAHALDARQLLSAETGLDGFLNGNRLTGGPKSMRMDTIPVYGIIQRGQLAFIDLVPGFQAETVFHFHMNFHLSLVRSGNLVYTDRYKEYDGLIFCGNDTLPYHIIRKQKKLPGLDETPSEFWEYAQDRLRRFRGISCQRFPLYLKELEFRFNNRGRPLFETLISYLCAIVQERGQDESV